MITLWGRRNSVNVQKVLWTLGELGLAFEHVDAGGDAGGLDAPAFRAMNPHGRVPVLKDGETAIWESNTIIRYLCAQYSGGDLCPAGPAARAEAEEWMD
jgi:glutathione S-transferase